jgi:hypothetical protein
VGWRTKEAVVVVSLDMVGVWIHLPFGGFSYLRWAVMHIEDLKKSQIEWAPLIE